ncbi:hypothetical protein BH23CHL8_BH23CHL8_16520 [soil metagenome]
MRMSGWRAAIVLGLIPIVVGGVYWFLNYSAGTDLTSDAAGATMLVALGLGMGFGTLVLVRGARDL